jgi:20S proteasome alpha/beta subunit
MNLNIEGIAVTGYGADGRQIVNRAREEAANYKAFYLLHPLFFI